MTSLSDETLALLRQQIKQVRIPQENDPVEKDECMLSFDNQFSPDGLFTNLKTWQSFGRDYVALDSKLTSQLLYLYQKFTKVPKIQPINVEENNKNKEVTKLALGMEGGFAFENEKYEILKKYALCVLPKFEFIDLSNNNIPLNIVECCNTIILHKGIAAHEEIKQWEEMRFDSQYSRNLIQIDKNDENYKLNKPSPNPQDWKCFACQHDKNLWFNLSDGYIGCGRPQPDGSGGCGAALQHFENTGEIYPLVVKLGTITPKGGDVYSYAENNEVIDSLLSDHLAYWGIDIMKMEKYEKTIEELNIDFNKNFAWNMILESGHKLEHVRGEGLIGLSNLGNSCYMNSLLQVLYSLDETKAKYFKHAKEILSLSNENISHDNNNVNSIANNYVIQSAKLAVALLSDRYILQQQKLEKEEQLMLAEQQKQQQSNANDANANDKKDEKDEKEERNVECVSVTPRMFKRLVGKEHPEFNTNKQQDVVEYFRHLLEFASRRELNSPLVKNVNVPSLKNLFKFQIEERLECQASHKVRYSTSEDLVLRIDIDLNDVVNKDEVRQYKERETKRRKLNEENKDKNNDSNLSTDTTNVEQKPNVEKTDKEEDKVLGIIRFDQCLQHFIGDTLIEDWLSPATNKKGTALKCNHIQTFPPYLAIQIQRYYLTEQWTPAKHDVIVEVPEEINLEFMRGAGLQPNEELLPKINDKQSDKNNKAIVPDDNIVQQLLNFGMFTENACKRAALAVQNANADLASQWLFFHENDADINDPLPSVSSDNNNNDNNNIQVNDNLVTEIVNEFGVLKEYVEIVLRHTNNDKARAVEWYFNHIEDLDSQIAILQSQQAVQNVQNNNNNNSNNNNESNKAIDGKGEYSLFAIISHLGQDPNHGHYVCHIKKNNKWYFFNDSKVAISENPPFGHGYLYIFKRSSDK